MLPRHQDQNDQDRMTMDDCISNANGVTKGIQVIKEIMNLKKCNFNNVVLFNFFINVMIFIHFEQMLFVMFRYMQYVADGH